jgi:hypothetical protein
MRKILMLMTSAIMLATSLPAVAGGGHYHGHKHKHARIGVYIGAPLVYAPWWAVSRPYHHRPYYYEHPAYYYAPPPVVVRERVVIREPLVYYDERGNPVSAQPRVAQAPAQPQPSVQPQPDAPAPTWYFCADTQKYYPYVQTCASPWQRVVPQSPPQ